MSGTAGSPALWPIPLPHRKHPPPLRVHVALHHQQRSIRRSRTAFLHTRTATPTPSNKRGIPYGTHTILGTLVNYQVYEKKQSVGRAAVATSGQELEGPTASLSEGNLRRSTSTLGRIRRPSVLPQMDSPLAWGILARFVPLTDRQRVPCLHDNPFQPKFRSLSQPLTVSFSNSTHYWFLLTL